MQAVLLCGGRGTRIRGEVENVPKPMVKVGGYPILWHIMKTYAHYGHKDFVLCLGYRGWDIKSYFLNYHLMHSDVELTVGDSDVQAHPRAEKRDGGHHEEMGWRMVLAETGIEALTGARVKRIEKYIEGDTFMLTYGDGVADIDIGRLIEFHKSHGKIATLTAVRPPSRFGDLELEGSQVVRFQEKPEVGQAAINGGYFVLNRGVFEYLDDREDLIFEREPLQRLAADGQLMAFPHEGFWLPMDTYREWSMLERMWNSGEAPWKIW